MTKSSVTCCHVCGKEIIGVEPLVVGFTAGDKKLHCHPGQCAAAHRQRAAERVDCRECRKPLERAADAARPGRVLEYHDKCRKAADRRRAKVWRDAAKSRMPESVDECATQRWNVTDLVNSIRSGRLNGAVPRHAMDLLVDYHGKLERHERSLIEAMRRQREVERAEAIRAELERRTAAAQAEVEAFAKALEEEK